jgi:hypothetical protein
MPFVLQTLTNPGSAFFGQLNGGGVWPTYQPGGTAVEGQVFTDWALLMDFVTGLTVAPFAIIFDGRFNGVDFECPISTAGMPAAGWDIRRARIVSAITAPNGAAVFEDGAKFAPDSWQMTETMRVISRSNSPIYEPEEQYALIVLFDGGTMRNEGTAPMIVPGLTANSTIIVAQTAGVFETTGVHIVDGVANDINFACFLYGGSGINADTIRSGAGGGVQVTIYGTGCNVGDQPLAGGYFARILETRPINLLYVPLAGANWAGTPPDNSQEAFERIESLLVTLNAGPIP